MNFALDGGFRNHNPYLCRMTAANNPDYQPFLENLPFDAFNKMQLAFFQKAGSCNKVILLAPTGSGKTLAYLIPLVQQLQEEGPSKRALIVIPSRELALQIEQVFKSLKTGISSCTCYGGHEMKVETNRLKENPGLVLGTPGRLSDHVLSGNIEPDDFSLIVLDEFDKSLQLGFHEQLKMLFEKIKGEPLFYLTSATLLDPLPDMLPSRDWETLDFLKDNSSTSLELKLVRTSSVEKADTLLRLLADLGGESTLVFCNHRDAVNRISQLLTENNFAHALLHGGMEQIDREKNLIRFRNGSQNLLIATDLASRGLDIPEIRQVVHYQLPTSEQAYIHRNGRTARMHASGTGYLVLAHDEHLPEYLTKELPEHPVPADFTIPEPSSMECLYISGGKKDKISKGDVLGFLTKTGGLMGNEIGLISILETATYVAIPRQKVSDLLKNTSGQKLKKVKVKLEIAN